MFPGVNIPKFSSELWPDFYRFDYMNPGECQVYSYRPRRVPYTWIRDIIKERGTVVQAAYQFGESANGRYISYSHVFLIDSEPSTKGLSYPIRSEHISSRQMDFVGLHKALNSAPLDHMLGNVEAQQKLHEILLLVSYTDLSQLTAIEINQDGKIMEQFELYDTPNRKTNPLESELDCIGSVHLPLFTVYTTETALR